MSNLILLFIPLATITESEMTASWHSTDSLPSVRNITSSYLTTEPLLWSLLPYSPSSHGSQTELLHHKSQSHHVIPHQYISKQNKISLNWLLIMRRLKHKIFTMVRNSQISDLKSCPYLFDVNFWNSTPFLLFQLYWPLNDHTRCTSTR